MEEKKRHSDPPHSHNQDERGNRETAFESSRQHDTSDVEGKKDALGEESAGAPEAAKSSGIEQLPAHLTFLTLEGKWARGTAKVSETREERNPPTERIELNNLLQALAFTGPHTDSASGSETAKNTAGEKRGHSFSRASEEGILIIDTGGRILYANDHAGTILGAPAEGLVDRILVKTNFTFTSENQELERENSDDSECNAITGNLPADGIVGIIRPDGSVSWTRTHSLSLLERGKVTGSPTAVLLKKIELDHFPATLEKSMNETITNQLQQLEKVNQELEDFNYSMSHDLKSHIFVIEGYCSFIEEEYAEELNKDIIKCLHKIRTRAMTMKNLLDALLRLSKINAGPLNRQKVNLSDIVQNILNDFSALESWRNTSIYVQPDLHEQCDPNLAHTAIYNLLDNAWKYTANNPLTAIEFGAEDDGREKVFYVRDNGIGFDMKDAENIFKPFKRLRSESEYRGTGIGLVTVRKIVQRHDGRIWVESELGKGATFYFTLTHPED